MSTNYILWILHGKYSCVLARILAGTCTCGPIAILIIFSKILMYIYIYLVVLLCTTKVYEFDHTPTGDHDIGSFDVSVDDGVRVKIVKSSSDLTSVVSNSAIVQWTESV